MEFLVANLSGQVRNETLYGRDYVVCPATLIVPGVLNGSKGPLYYPPEEVTRNPSAWNNMPILVYHPVKGSGRDPATLNRQGVGLVLNAEAVGKELKAELWFDHARTLAIDPRVIDTVANGKQMELSTGLGVQEDPAPEGAVYNSPSGEDIPYKGVARNYRPDHLAVLPDQVGACSLADGCGVNNATKNELSQDDVRSTLQSLLQDKVGQPADPEGPWIVDVYESYMIYRSQDGLFRLGYSKENEQLKLSDGDPQAVQRKTVYEVVGNVEGHVGPTDSLNQEVPTMAKMTSNERKTIIDGLITNSCCWEEQHRKELENMTDVMLQQTKVMADKQTELENLQNAADEGAAGLDPSRNPLTQNQGRKGTTQPQAPALTPEQEEILNFGREAMLREKQELIGQIVANVSDDERPKQVEYFSTKGIDELRRIAAVMPKPQVQNRGPMPDDDYYGPASTVDAVRNGQPMQDVVNKEDDLDVAPPDIDWRKGSAFDTSK